MTVIVYMKYTVSNVTLFDHLVHNVVLIVKFVKFPSSLLLNNKCGSYRG